MLGAGRLDTVVDPLTVPVAPVEPVGPVQPVGPTGPNEPGGPVYPVGPVNAPRPVAPVKPVGPVSPVGPVRPVGPVGEVAPVGPVGPVGPPDGPVGPPTTTTGCAAIGAGVFDCVDNFLTPAMIAHDQPHYSNALTTMSATRLLIANGRLEKNKQTTNDIGNVLPIRTDESRKQNSLRSHPK